MFAKALIFRSAEYLMDKRETRRRVCNKGRLGLKWSEVQVPRMCVVAQRRCRPYPSIQKACGRISSIQVSMENLPYSKQMGAHKEADRSAPPAVRHASRYDSLEAQTETAEHDLTLLRTSEDSRMDPTSDRENDPRTNASFRRGDSRQKRRPAFSTPQQI